MTYFPLSLEVNSRGASSVVMLYLPRDVNNEKINIHYSRRKITAKVFTGDANVRWGRGGVAVSTLDFRSEDVGGSRLSPCHRVVSLHKKLFSTLSLSLNPDE